MRSLLGLSFVLALGCSNACPAPVACSEPHPNYCPCFAPDTGPRPPADAFVDPEDAFVDPDDAGADDASAEDAGLDAASAPVDANADANADAS